MKGTTIKATLLVFILASAVPLAACNDDDDTPTSPTAAGPTVDTTTPTTTTPAPTPTPTPAPTPSPAPSVTVSGTVSNLTRSGPDGLNITFRIDDFTIVRAAAGTPVVAGSSTENTDAVLLGARVTVQGTRTNGFLDATRITLDSQ